MQNLPLLIGQFDSPFVRRVAIAMTLYEVPFEHRVWSVFRDAEQIAAFNPLRRVPTLVLPGGEVLVESAAILDALDDQVPDERLLLPRRGPVRRAGLRWAALACGLADKGVALVYEKVARDPGSQSERWAARCRAQVGDALRLLERDCARCNTPYLLGESLSHADVALAVVVHFLRQGVPAAFEHLALPALLAHEARCHERAEFQAINQPLNFPT